VVENQKMQENSQDSAAAENDLSLQADDPKKTHENQHPYWRAVRSAFLLTLLIGVLIISFADRLRDLLFIIHPAKEASLSAISMEPRQFEKELRNLQKQVALQKKRLMSLTPQDMYLIINSSGNRVTLMQGDKVIHEGLCSTGSYTVLKTADNKEIWVSQTPRGMLHVQNKIVNPVWRMPDWAFIEEGLPVPPRDSSERFEFNVLGDYALDLGRGYLIHGTLYQRFLGMPVTHGCVRLGDEELKIIYHNLTIGSKVFIY
jgi:hypothetical protein